MSIDAMKTALEALETIADEVFSPYNNQLGNAILALRAAIEQAEQQERYTYGTPLLDRFTKQAEAKQHSNFRGDSKVILQAEKQEPVAWMVKAHGLLQRLSRRADVADEIACQYRKDDPKADMFPLYTAPPQRQPLTDEEIDAVLDAAKVPEYVGSEVIDKKIARAIERAHGIKE